MIGTERGGVRGGFLLGAAATVLVFLGTGAVRPPRIGFISGFLDTLSLRAGKATGRPAGPVVARVEGTVVRKSTFDRMYRVFLKASNLSGKRLQTMYSDKQLKQRFLGALVDDIVFMMDFRKQIPLQENPEFLLHLLLKFRDVIKEYYLVTRIASTINTKVGEKEIGEMYDKLKGNPRYAQALVRMDIARVKEFIRRRIIQGRKIDAAAKYITRLKMRYRIETFEDRL